MKKYLKILGIIAIAAVLGFSFFSCELIQSDAKVIINNCKDANGDYISEDVYAYGFMSGFEGGQHPYLLACGQAQLKPEGGNKIVDIQKYGKIDNKSGKVEMAVYEIIYKRDSDDKIVLDSYNDPIMETLQAYEGSDTVGFVICLKGTYKEIGDAKVSFQNGDGVGEFILRK